jgi:hypothetical protein
MRHVVVGVALVLLLFVLVHYFQYQACPIMKVFLILREHSFFRRGRGSEESREGALIFLRYQKGMGVITILGGDGGSENKSRQGVGFFLSSKK